MQATLDRVDLDPAAKLEGAAAQKAADLLLEKIKGAFDTMLPWDEAALVAACTRALAIQAAASAVLPSLPGSTGRDTGNGQQGAAAGGPVGVDSGAPIITNLKALDVRTHC